MKNKKLTREFFDRDTRIVAKELLGKFLVRRIDRKSFGNTQDHRGNYISAMITETEAYCGPNDLASHASRGRTPRTEVMFGKPGIIYVYLIYGMYHCLNIVTEKEDYPAAVLIRGVIVNQKLNIKHQNDKLKIKNSNKKLPVPTPLGRDPDRIVGITSYGLPVTNLNGPGKLCRYFQIDRGLNAEDLIASKELWIEDPGIIIKPNQIGRLPRIGVDYAGKYKDKKWRYCVKL